MLTTRQLIDSGLTRRTIARAVRAGQLSRVRRGYYLTREATADLAMATRFGALSCVSGLAAAGVWTMPDPAVHVRVGVDSRIRPTQTGLRIHRSGRAPRAAIDSPIDCFARMLRCTDDLAIVVAADSLLNQGLVSHVELERVLSPTTRGRRILGRIDGRAESGIESIARVRLRSRGIALRSQVAIAGVGRVDLLIGDRLVIELDGRQWHDRASTFEADRVRDAALVVGGYLVLRYSYRRVMLDWDSVETEVLSLVRRDRHVTRRGSRRQPSA